MNGSFDAVEDYEDQGDNISAASNSAMSQLLQYPSRESTPKVNDSGSQSEGGLYERGNLSTERRVSWRGDDASEPFESRGRPRRKLQDAAVHVVMMVMKSTFISRNKHTYSAKTRRAPAREMRAAAPLSCEVSTGSDCELTARYAAGDNYASGTIWPGQIRLGDAAQGRHLSDRYRLRPPFD